MVTIWCLEAPGWGVWPGWGRRVGKEGVVYLYMGGLELDGMWLKPKQDISGGKFLPLLPLIYSHSHVKQNKVCRIHLKQDRHQKLRPTMKQLTHSPWKFSPRQNTWTSSWRSKRPDALTGAMASDSVSLMPESSMRKNRVYSVLDRLASW